MWSIFYALSINIYSLQKNADFKDNSFWKQCCHGSLGSFLHLIPEVWEYVQMVHGRKNVETESQERAGGWEEDKKGYMEIDLSILRE